LQTTDNPDFIKEKSMKIINTIKSLPMILTCIFFQTVLAVESVNVYVTDQSHTFGGFGANTREWTGDITAPEGQLSAEDEDYLIRLIWVDLNLTSVRFLSKLTLDDDYLVERARKLIAPRLKYVNSVNPGYELRHGMAPYNLIVIPTWANNWTPDHAPRVAEVIDLIQQSVRDTAKALTGNENFDFQIGYTEYGNEPNQTHTGGAVPVPGDLTNIIVSEIRNALDDRGLTATRLIGPGPSGCDGYMWQAIESVMGDPDAITALTGFSYHAYNMSLIYDMANWIVTAKTDPPFEIWQTESCTPEGDADWNDADSQAAVQTWVKFLCDVNQGCNYWMYFMDAGEYDAVTPGCFLIGLNTTARQYVPYLKFYYLRHLARTFVPGTEMRRCTTDVYGGVNTRMEYTYGDKPPVAASAGIRPDGSWALSVANHTGLTSLEFFQSKYFPRDDYEVTFNIADLADQDLIKFYASSGFLMGTPNISRFP
jgi:hypothetical protein